MKKICALLLTAAAVFAFASCAKRTSAPGSVPTQSVSVCIELDAQLAKIEALGSSRENKQLVCVKQDDNYAEYVVAVYDGKGEKTDETSYRFYRDSWWYENRGKEEFKDSETAEFDDTMWCITSKSSVLKGKTYAENEQSLYKELKGTYSYK